MNAKNKVDKNENACLYPRDKMSVLYIFFFSFFFIFVFFFFKETLMENSAGLGVVVVIGERVEF